MEKLPSISKQNQREHAMKTKEKAKELVSKYMEIDLQPFSDYGHYIEKDVAKEFALIAVHEILLACALETKGKFEYYLEVKKEIEKL